MKSLLFLVVQITVLLTAAAAFGQQTDPAFQGSGRDVARILHNLRIRDLPSAPAFRAMLIAAVRPTERRDGLISKAIQPREFSICLRAARNMWSFPGHFRAAPILLVFGA
jgi:hypothetical protein